MKKNALRVLSIAALAALFLGACGKSDVPIPSKTAESEAGTSEVLTPISSETPVPSTSENDNDTVCDTIAEARAIALAAGTEGTTVNYTVHGYIKSISNTTYGQMVIYDETGELSLYGLYGQDGTGYSNLEYKPVAGDEITVEGVLKTYNDTPEMGRATLLSYVHHEQVVPDTVELETIADAIAEAQKIGETYSLGKYRITAEIKSIESTTYGQMTIGDDTGSLSIYGVYGPNGEYFNTLDPVPSVGDVITLEGSLHYYKEAAEMGKATMTNLIHNETEFDDSDYSVMTVAQAREKDDESKVELTGVVAQYNVSSSKAKTGFWLVDGTESIYVYGENVAALVNVGNAVTIAGTVGHFIASSETTNAAKWGYKGALQITDPHLITNDKGSTEVDLSWVKTTTVKDIMDKDPSENITTTIYKVNALVSKSEGSGFVNYYIDDIDGKTGSYVYTLANGSDLSWLEEFDGKICTVYLSVLNAKSTSTGCAWRFYPIKVINENYKFDTADAPEYAITYEVNDQFEDSYSADPELEVITSVSSELLGFENCVITYSSSNNDAVYFEETDGKMIMHTGKAGTAIVTITATYGDYSASTTETINVLDAKTIDTITISEAWASVNSTEVTVKGVVAGSYTNKHGFFIVDSTGIIPVLPTDGDTSCATVAIGDEVIVKGTKEIYNTKGETILGQTQISSATIVANNYGKHEIDDSKFIKNKTIAEIYELANKPLVDQPYAYEAEVYVTESSGNHPNLLFKDSAEDTNYIQCYASSISQYAWITNAFLNKTATVSFMLVNPNNKAYWRGVPFKATDGQTTVYNTLYVGAER